MLQIEIVPLQRDRALHSAMQSTRSLYSAPLPRACKTATRQIRQPSLPQALCRPRQARHRCICTRNPTGSSGRDVRLQSISGQPLGLLVLIQLRSRKRNAWPRARTTPTQNPQDLGLQPSTCQSTLEDMWVDFAGFCHCLCRDVGVLCLFCLEQSELSQTTESTTRPRPHPHLPLVQAHRVDFHSDVVVNSILLLYSSIALLMSENLSGH